MIEYVLFLDRLDGERARFAHPDGVTCLHMTHAEWVAAGRPGTVTVSVSP